MKNQILLLCFMSLSLASCSYPLSLVGLASRSSAEDSNGASSLTPVELETSAKKILSQNCSSCHGTNSGSADVYGLNDTAHMIDAGLITTGNPSQSPIYEEIESGSMPPSGPLSRDDQETIRLWIAGLNSTAPTTTPTNPSPAPAPQPAPAPAPPPPQGPVSTFSYIEKNILTPSCVACHSSRNARAGVALDSYNGVLKTVKVANPTKSLLYRETQSGSMPPRPRKVLNSEQLQLILSWIEDGAKNN